LLDPPKLTQIRDFWFEKKPSGNPGGQVKGSFIRRRRIETVPTFFKVNILQQIFLKRVKYFGESKLHFWVRNLVPR
jgi:hypothetical protein